MCVSFSLYQPILVAGDYEEEAAGLQGKAIGAQGDRTRTI